MKKIFAVSISIVLMAGHPVMAAETNTDITPAAVLTEETENTGTENALAETNDGEPDKGIAEQRQNETATETENPVQEETVSAVQEENADSEQEDSSGQGNDSCTAPDEENAVAAEAENSGEQESREPEDGGTDVRNPAEEASSSENTGTGNTGTGEESSDTAAADTAEQKENGESVLFSTDGQTAENSGTLSAQEETPIKTGLVAEENGLKYYDGNGDSVCCCFVGIGGKSYYFGEDGCAVTGGFEKDGKRYLGCEDGTLYCGWHTENGSVVFYGEDFSMVTGSTLETETGRYTFDGNGVLTECSVPDVSSIPQGYSGKAFVNGSVRYCSDGKIVTGWHTADGVTVYLSEEGGLSFGYTQTDKGFCYFDRETGSLVTDRIITDETGTYFAGKDGILKTGIAKDPSGKTLAFDKNGRMIKNGWFDDNGRRYYLENDGTAATGWMKLGTRTYHFGSDGKMDTGWKTIGGRVYYFFDGQYDSYRASILGAEASGWKTINGKKYYFIDSRCKGFRPEIQGVRASGFKEISGKTYYFLDSRASTLNDSNRESLADGIIKINGKNTFYFENGIARKKEGWINSAGKWYYLKKNGAAVSGWKKVGGKWYYMNPKTCERKTGWLKSGKKWYYLKKDGAMKTGWLKTGGKWYFLNSDGAMKTGWMKVKGKYYFVLSNRNYKTGWLTTGGKQYYLNKDGSRRTGWFKTGGKLYYLDSNGVLRTGWTKIKNRLFYMNKGGGIRTGVTLLGGKVYYFTANGIMKPDYTRDASRLAKLSSKTKPVALRIIKSAIESKYDKNLYSGKLNNKKEYQPMINAVNDTYFPYVGQVTVGHTFVDGTKNVTNLSIRFSFQTKNNRSWLKENMEIDKTISRNLSKATSSNRSVSRKVSDITSYICNTYRYDYDAYYNDTATWDTYSTIKKGKGVCWNYAEYFFWMCKKENIPCRMVNGYTNGGSHEWNQVKLGGVWNDIDVCWIDGAGWKYYLSRNGWNDHRFVTVDETYE